MQIQATRHTSSLLRISLSLAVCIVICMIALLVSPIIDTQGGVFAQRTLATVKSAPSASVSVSTKATTPTTTSAVTATEAMTKTDSLTTTEVMTKTEIITKTNTTKKAEKVLKGIEVTVRTDYSIRLRLRDTPSAKGKFLTYLPNGSTWTYIEYSADSKWIRIAVPGFGKDGSGWVSAEWVEVKEIYE